MPAGTEDLVSKTLEPWVGDARLACVAGGSERSDSVRAALGLVPVEDIDCILVHDAARPFVPAAVIERVVAAVLGGAPAVIPVLPVTDTIKRVDAAGRVVETPERASLVAVQTPQGFEPALLRRAHATPVPGATDDAMLAERLGVTVQTVTGADDAFKITHPRDLLLAEAILAERTAG